MSSLTKRYRVDGTDEYTIEYRRESDGTYALYCHEHPRDPFGKGASTHHLYESGRICVASGHEPNTLDRATAIASVWMHGFSRYVRSGTFPRGGGRVNV
jgi:hypothetical protein